MPPTDKKEHKDLPLVPESVLKRRHDLDDIRRRRAAEGGAVAPSKKHKKDGTYVIKPSKLLAAAKSRRNQEIRFSRVLKKGMQKRASNKKEMAVKTVVDDEDAADVDDDKRTVTYQANSVGAPMVFVVRIREGQIQPPRRIANTLAKLRLRKAYQGVFVKYTPQTRRMLHTVEPWVLYGPPSEAVVKDLMERRSFGTVEGKRTPISDNTVIERQLGEQHGIICMEDLIHELVHVGDAFSAAAKFLWPFQLTCPRSKFEKEKLGAHQGKDYGDKGQDMDSYIRQML